MFQSCATGVPYAVTTSITYISNSELLILWLTPSALLNQDVTSFDVSVRSLSSTNSYHRAQSVRVEESPIVNATELGQYNYNCLKDELITRYKLLIKTCDYLCSKFIHVNLCVTAS